MRTTSNPSKTLQRGLTLIEIMVVLAILGILMTLLGNRLFGAGDKAKVKATDLKMQMIKQNIDLFRLQYNSLPTSLDALWQCTDQTGPGCVPQMREEDLTDAWGNPLAYRLDNGGRSYLIKSFGADGKDDGTGVNYDVTLTGP